MNYIPSVHVVVMWLTLALLSGVVTSIPGVTRDHLLNHFLVLVVASAFCHPLFDRDVAGTGILVMEIYT